MSRYSGPVMVDALCEQSSQQVLATYLSLEQSGPICIENAPRASVPYPLGPRGGSVGGW